MLPRSPRSQGVFLLFSAIVIVLAVFTAGWLTAPNINQPPDEGEYSTIVGVQAGPLQEIDSTGDIIWSKSNGAYWEVNSLRNESVFAAFVDGDYAECGPYEPLCTRTGVRVVNSSGEPQVTFEWSYPVRTRQDSQTHAAEPLPNGEFVVADMEHEQIFTVDRDTEEKTWVWNASSHYSAPPDPTKEDWLHINDVDYLGDDQFLVSVRNEHQILILERGEGIVEVINQDKDLDLINEQHNPHWLGPNAVLVADSQNNRVVELHKSKGEWEIAWAIYGANDIPFDWPRDADRLPNGNTLITDSRNNRVVEVTEDGDTVASYQVEGTLPYEADRRGVGERQSVSTYANGTNETPVEINAHLKDYGIPVLSVMVLTARHVFSLSHWVSEIQAFGVLVGAVLFIGSVDRFVKSTSIPWVSLLNQPTKTHDDKLFALRELAGVLTLITGFGVLINAITYYQSGMTRIWLGLGIVSMQFGWIAIMAEQNDIIGRRVPERAKIVAKFGLSSSGFVVSAAFAYTAYGGFGPTVVYFSLFVLTCLGSVYLLGQNKGADKMDTDRISDDP